MKVIRLASPIAVVAICASGTPAMAQNVIPPAAMVQMDLLICPKADPENRAACLVRPVVLERGYPLMLMECLVIGQQAAADWMNKHRRYVADYFAMARCSSSGMPDDSTG